MNFIAHLLLSGDHPDLKLGNFMGDFVRNRELALYPPAVQAGVRLHRLLDTYTDNHPAVRQAMRLLYPAHGKYAAVLIDLFFDYILAKHWTEFGPESLRSFIDRQYDFLAARQAYMPGRLQERLPRMIADDWLMSYTTLQGLDRALGYMKRRVSKPEKLEGATDSLRTQLDQLDRHFLRFFPEAQAYARQQQAQVLNPRNGAKG